MKRTRSIRALVLAAALLVPVSCGGGTSVVDTETSARPSTNPTSEPDGDTDSTSTEAGSTEPRPTEQRPTTSTPPEPAPVTSAAGDDTLADLELGQVGVTAVMLRERWQVTAAAELTNNSDGFITNIDWTADLLAADGSVLDHSQGSGGLVGPDTTTWINPQFFLDEDAEEPVRMEVTLSGATRSTELTVANGVLPLADVALRLINAKAYLDVNDVLHLEGTFLNESDARLTQVGYHCGAYRGGILVGGAFGFVVEFLAGEETGFDTTSALARVDPVPDEVRCAAAPVNTTTYEPGVASSGLATDAGLSYNPAGLDEREHDTNVGITATNPTDLAALGVKVQVDLLDASGALTQVWSQDIPYVLPGQTFYTGLWPVVVKESPPPATLRVRVAVAEWGDPSDAQLAGLGPLDLTEFRFDVNDAQYVLTYGDGDIVGTVTNQSAQPVTNAQVACSLLLDGRPVGGGSWTLDPLPVGVPVEFDIILGYNADIDHDDVICQVNLTAISEIG